ncbi:Com family DNA-binding transcriptional regulator [Cupriavidus metallidurans]|uniref:Com family DNA-binding transcriptional regulator n=1 Tax=Cupriavidus metallidurans TaxID=119219 RepID=A0A482IQS0_9BURK|nr:Com family DNA-binding transcriptional regulator [Cupriavidus metallidurans]QBP09867.1 Com family DNA-binding transcriptional regulator [Cupriavidus metallidurans]
MREIRCGACNRKLGEGDYSRLAIKCPRCKTMNFLRAERPEPAGRRASDSKEVSRDEGKAPTGEERIQIP